MEVFEGLGIASEKVQVALAHLKTVNIPDKEWAHRLLGEALWLIAQEMKMEPILKIRSLQPSGLCSTEAMLQYKEALEMQQQSWCQEESTKKAPKGVSRDGKKITCILSKQNLKMKIYFSDSAIEGIKSVELSTLHNKKEETSRILWLCARKLNQYTPRTPREDSTKNTLCMVSIDNGSKNQWSEAVNSWLVSVGMGALSPLLSSVYFDWGESAVEKGQNQFFCSREELLWFFDPEEALVYERNGGGQNPLKGVMETIRVHALKHHSSRLCLDLQQWRDYDWTQCTSMESLNRALDSITFGAACCHDGNPKNMRQQVIRWAPITWGLLSSMMTAQDYLNQANQEKQEQQRQQESDKQAVKKENEGMKIPSTETAIAFTQEQIQEHIESFGQKNNGGVLPDPQQELYAAILRNELLIVQKDGAETRLYSGSEELKKVVEALKEHVRMRMEMFNEPPKQEARTACDGYTRNRKL